MIQVETFRSTEEAAGEMGGQEGHSRDSWGDLGIGLDDNSQ